MTTSSGTRCGRVTMLRPRELVRRHPGDLRVVVLTTFDLDEYAFAALRAGASGFLLKDAPAEEVIDAIRTVHSAAAVIAASTTRRLLDHVAVGLPSTLEEDTGLGALTERERRVMVEIARRATNSEIAASLHLAEATVKTHVGRILSKLGLRDRVQIVIRAYEAGLVRRGPHPQTPGYSPACRQVGACSSQRWRKCRESTAPPAPERLIFCLP